MKNEWGYLIGRVQIFDNFRGEKTGLSFMEDFRIGPHTGKCILETRKFIIMIKHKK